MNKALIIIDVQNDYFPNGKYELYKSEEALKEVKELLQYFRENKFPVYFIQHVSSKDSSFFVPDTQGVKIHDDIKPLDSEEVIVKHFPNSFLKTNLQSELEKNSVTELVVCGMMTHMCVDTTVRAAKDLGYDVTLVSDACTTRDLVWKGKTIPADIVQSVYMESLNQGFAKVVTYREFLNL